MARLDKPRRRTSPDAPSRPAKARRKRRARGVATRIRSALRRSSQSSSVGRAIRRRIRTVSKRLHGWFIAPPLGPVRLGLACCTAAFVCAGAAQVYRARAASAEPGPAPVSSAGPAPVSDASTGPHPAAIADRASSSQRLAAPVRAVWVARFHYRDPQDIAQIIRNCRTIGATTVLWQVRGEATVAYPSSLEPWSREYGFADPGFDPLAIAVREAHENGLRIEAWCNVMPAWKGRKPPPMKDHLYHARPEWFLYDVRGRRQPLCDEYVILNPCNPYARRHIVAVLEEIATKYPVDGIHLDYVRYAWDTEANARDRYPRDPDTLALYRDQTGKQPDDDPRAWDHWRANQLTRLVADIRDMLDARRPDAALTAATWGSPYRGYDDYLQNAVGWLRTGLLDAVMPMAYTAKRDELERMIGDYRTLAPDGRIVPGLGLYKLTAYDEVAGQLDYCRQLGGELALFSYESLFPTHADRSRPRPDPRSERLRGVRRDAVVQFASP